MISLQSLLVVLAISSASLASPTHKCSIKETLSAPPPGWVEDTGYQFDKDAATIRLRIGLTQQNMEEFHETMIKISTPGDKLYGNHLPQHKIDEMIAPKQHTKDVVMEWLNREGLSRIAEFSPRSDSVVIEGSIKQIERLLKSEYKAFVNSKTNDRILRTLQYSLPDSLEGHISMVQPTTFFGLRELRSTISEVKPLIDFDVAGIESVDAVQAVAGCTGSSITPTCLANLYSFAAAANESVGLMGIAGFLLQHPVKSDLVTFLNKYAYFSNKGLSYTCTTVNGGTCPTTDVQDNIVEANLDVQYARAITSSIPNVYYSTGGSGPFLGSGTNTDEPWTEWLTYMLALPTASLPQTISISYGDDSANLPLSYQTTVCNQFAQLGAKGVSVLVASGDSGVGDTCTISGKKSFTTSFPASCPFVTTVGGTTGTAPEGGWSGGGGGFSEIFARPSYQNATVSKWLTTDKTHTANAAYFNSSGRAYPDVSAQSTNFIVELLGSAAGVSGTSAACPTFASVIQLLNSQRLAAGKVGLGFLNPWLYGVAAGAMNDVTSGKNTGCSGVITGAGFSAVSGWDPSTGLGTPNYVKMLAVSQATA